MNRLPRYRRTAFTLIEVLITITIGSSVMVMSAALLHKSFELHKTAQGRLQREHLLHRLIQQFTSDVYAAVDFEVLNPSHLTLDLFDGERVVYSVVGSELTREVQDGVRESVELGDAKTASFKLVEDSKLVCLEFLVEPVSATPIVRRRIEVAIGRIATAAAPKDGISPEVPQ